MTYKVVILDENLPVPFDRRVWREAQALNQAGYEVNVVCPATSKHPSRYEVLDGIHVHRYRSVHEASRPVGYLVEYSVSLISMLVLVWRIHLRGRVDVIQACNPPDLLFLVALPFQLLTGTRLIFDHHDVSPELLVAKGHAPHGALVRMASVFEKLTFRAATVSIATNESYRRIAIERGGMNEGDVFVVRSGPDLRNFQPGGRDDHWRHGRRYLVAYVGIMGIQEGIDYLLDAARIIIQDRQREDVTFVLAGSGAEFDRLTQRCQEMQLSKYVYFLGYIPDDELMSLLANADVCINPDEANEMNDISTMTKVLEYMAMSKPIVQFDLKEGRVSAGDSSLYAARNDSRSMADCLCELLDDPRRRERMGQIGRQRLEGVLRWELQIPSLLAAYERTVASTSRHQAPRRRRRRTRSSC